jgi:hypothetical protein
MKILELIEYNSSIIEISNEKYDYFHIAHFKDLQFSYGLSKEGWIVEEDGKFTLIRCTDTNYISFFKLLEITFDDFVNEIETTIVNNKLIEYQWVDLFPINGVIKTCLNSESTYWSELGLKLLLLSRFHSTELSIFLSEKLNKKWLTQKLRHQIKNYLSYSAKSSNE